MNLNRQSGRAGAKSTHPGQISFTRMVFVIQTYQKNPGKYDLKSTGLPGRSGRYGHVSEC